MPGSCARRASMPRSCVWLVSVLSCSMPRRCARRDSIPCSLCAGLDPRQLHQVGFEFTQLCRAGFDAQQLRQAGFELKQLHQADFDAWELRCASFDATQLRPGAARPEAAGGVSASTADVRRLLDALWTDGDDAGSVAARSGGLGTALTSCWIAAS